jgi:threonine dehydratase
MTSFDVTLADIEAARARVSAHVRRTPSVESADVSARLGPPLRPQARGLQLAGSFKVRGVFNKVIGLSDTERQRGLVTVSGGNHAIALAHVAGTLGIEALVLMPKVTPRFNLDLTAKLRAKIELCEDAAEAFAKAQAYETDGKLFVHPTTTRPSSPATAPWASNCSTTPRTSPTCSSRSAGAGSWPGVAAALKARKPDLTVYGRRDHGRGHHDRGPAAGEPVTIRPTSIARTLGAPFATRRTLAAAQSFLQEIVLVEDAPAVADLAWILQAEKVLCEPAAACTLTAARRIAPDLPGDAKVGLVLCGSNVSLHDVDAWRRDFAGPTP